MEDLNIPFRDYAGSRCDTFLDDTDPHFTLTLGYFNFNGDFGREGVCKVYNWGC